MKIFGWELTNANIAITFGAVIGGGASYAILRYLLKSSRPNFRSPQSRRSRFKKRYDGEPDPNLPLILEQEYGDFRAICKDSDPEAAAYLTELPEYFFAFPENFLNFITNVVAEHVTRYRQVLVLGSRTGYITFALGTLFDEVKGVEASFSQVVTCYQFQNLDQVKHNFPSEGAHKTISREYSSPIVSGGRFPQRISKDIRKKNKENVEFVNADLDKCPLTLYGEFQVVIIQNSLEDLANPTLFLNELKNSVLEDGLLIISSDYNWNKQIPNATNLGSFELMKKILIPDFKFVQSKNIPELLCECVRSCRIRNNHVTIWKRVPSNETNNTKAEVQRV